MNVALFFHVISVVVWVGGMFFAYMALRPVAARVLQPAERLTLWQGVFGRFFPWVWISVLLILVSGLWMFMLLGAGNAPVYVHAMFGLGVLMMLIFAHVFFAPYRRLKRAVAGQDWKSGGAALTQIRKLIGLNLALGMITIAVAMLARLVA